MELRLLRYFVTVAEERHFGRAAARLHMTQPPLSRAIRHLEADLGLALLHRSSAGVLLTEAGATLLEEARTLLDQAEQARARVMATAGLTIGILADTAEQAGLAAAFRRRHPGVAVRVREADLTDPTIGLRSGLVDVALTRAPFDDTGIRIHILRTDPVGVVLRADDPLAGRDSVRVDDLADRRWFQFPDGTDQLWRAYWNAGVPREGPTVRTVQECLQAVLWNGTVGLTPLTHALPDGLVAVRLADMPPSPMVLAWNGADGNPLVRSLLRLAAEERDDQLRRSGQAGSGAGPTR
ncbi:MULTISPECIES: LysR family transcriptional regulator [Streptosporangium]|uniref:DNA-binding transcriptional LysR family regulator n=1 Tax=Streptosporangium brasiliense TaxID=47480 RepID=A0ABT9RJ18_9ACTN|nr:LysR family transcriptional regulator [Streptosporangium brasiliense]MDP9869250.1 DNA-binding transcriptional LysR family regulator [Streptosporangium brasiliense]